MGILQVVFQHNFEQMWVLLSICESGSLAKERKKGKNPVDRCEKICGTYVYASMIIIFLPGAYRMSIRHGAETVY